jgi:predicted lipoprotein with Yx(FWY)xxD motif
MTAAGGRLRGPAAAALLAVCGIAPAHAFDANLPYPSEVALSEEGDQGFVFRRFPGSQRLYTYDQDHADRSYCNGGCASARPPVIAPAAAHSMGEWTLIRRDDGQMQWAYRGHPVYSMFHDEPKHPSGDGEDGVWHLLPYEK